MLRPRLVYTYTSTRPIPQSVDSATEHGIFCHNERNDRNGLANFASEFFANFALKKGVRDVLTQRTQRQRKERRESLRPLRPLRPPYLIAVAMTFSQMTVLAMDEILLRTEISGMGEEGTRRGTAGCRTRCVRPGGRAGRAPLPPSGPLCVRANVAVWEDAPRRGRGAGAAATRAALPCDAARFHVGTDAECDF